MEGDKGCEEWRMAIGEEEAVRMPALQGGVVVGFATRRILKRTERVCMGDEG